MLAGLSGRGHTPALHEIHVFLGPLDASEAVVNRYREVVNAYNAAFPNQKPMKVLEISFATYRFSSGHPFTFLLLQYDTSNIRKWKLDKLGVAPLSPCRHVT